MAARPTDRRLFLARLLARLPALLLAGAASTRAPGASPLPEPADGRPLLPALAARFEVSLAAPGQATRRQLWQLTRNATEITWLKGPAREEIWRRDTSGIRLERVMRADRHVIEYSAGELRALAVAIDWPTLCCLFPAANLALLTPRAPLRPGQPQRWAGRIGTEQVDLLWDPAAQLPVWLARQGANGRVLFKRIALHASAPPNWPRAEAGIEDFQRLDAADFGDMDYNPVVRRAQAEDERTGWRKPHHD